MKKSTIVKSLVAVSITAAMSMSAMAAPVASTPTLSIKGYSPYMPSVGVAKLGGTGVGDTISVGDIIYIPHQPTGGLGDSNPLKPLFQYRDGDDDKAASTQSLNGQAMVEWFILDDGVNYLDNATKITYFDDGTPGSKGGLINDSGMIMLKVPTDAKDKRIGFRITPLSKTGDPIKGSALDVINIAFLGGQLPPGTTDPNSPIPAPGIPGEPGTPGGPGPIVVDPKLPGDGSFPGTGDNNPGIDPGPNPDKPGAILPATGLAVYVYNTMNTPLDETDDIEVSGTNINPTVNATYRVAVYDRATSTFVTDDYKDTITWQFIDATNNVVKGNLAPKSLTFTTQETNASAKALHPTNGSEQGLRLQAVIDDGTSVTP